ncbi:immunoglobulin-like domain-containing protein [Sinanaerobacter sp. ZZT-01]|uniref:immunoglobulin-like domain-containing protein n=1 Tax=Sinanaerobacter sp. ZZT-01 TaxID=3111540 RepID=UPI002D765A62|nr:immunoglobulin-like domain-containing protein [Sinanaerobacter sp. ZZT-01]WRR92899.1 immunoglobulin-like domain-containing protein [Sinanaerobacter sp. ZZT-01]
MNYINKKILLLLDKLPDWCTGKREVFDNGFRPKYGNRDCSPKIQEEKIYLLKCYLVTLLFLVLLLTGFAVKTLLLQNNALSSLERPNYGENANLIPLKAEIRHGEVTHQKKITIKIQPQSLTIPEKKSLIKECEDKIEEEMLGKNKDAKHILYKLNLQRQDSVNPIQIDWISSEPQFIEEDGTVHRLELESSLEVDLTAKFTLYDYEEAHTYQVTLLPKAEEKLEGEFSAVIEDLRGQLSSNTYGDKLVLPKNLTQNITLKWYVQNTIPFFPLVIMACLLLFLIYKKRYYRMEREIQNYRESMKKEYPDFINKVVLLLNAGLVITSALERIALDAKEKKDHPLMEAIGEISDNVRESNASFSKELKLFARRSGIRELMRFAAIVCENLEKGSSLAEKLEAEGDLLWMTRKKQVEEEGRKVETKLILPLMILLLILVLITISPVLIEI